MLQIGRNIFSLLVSRILAAVILFLVYTHLIQYLGPNAAGEYGLMTAYLTVFSFFVDLGMQNFVIKKVSEDKANASKYLGNYFGIQFILGLAFMAIMFVLVWLGHYPLLVKQALMITGFSLFLTSLTMPFMAIINAFQKLGIIARVNFLNSIINAGMMFVAIVMHLNIYYLAFIPAVVAVFNIAVYWYIVHKKFSPFVFQFDFPFWKKLFVANLPFMWLTLFSIYNRVDTLILPHLRSFTENGYYTAVYKFWDTLAFLPAVVAASLFPYFSDMMSKGQRTEAQKVLSIYTRYMIALAIPMSIGSYILAHRITVAFFGQPFAPAAPALWLLVSAVSVLFIYVPVNSMIISQKTKTATIITGFNLLFNVVMNLIFIPIFGFVAAAVLTLCSEMIQLIGYTFVVQTQILSFPYFRNFIKPIIAGAVMGVVIYYLRNHNLWLLVGLGMVVYSAALLAIQFFRQEDWDLLKATISFGRNPIPDVPPTTHL